MSTDAAIVDSLLARSLDELADAPSFKAFPAGGHLCTLKWETKVINNKPAVIATLIYKETVELTDKTATPPAEGDETNVAFILKNNDGSTNEIAEGKLKEILAALKEKVGGTTAKDIMDASNNALVLVVTKVRKNKDSGQENTDIVKIDVA